METINTYCIIWHTQRGWTTWKLQNISLASILIYNMIYLLTAIGLSPGGSTHLHTNNTQNNTNNNRTTQIITTEQHKYILMWKSAGRAPSLRVLLWHLPYNWGKSTEKTSVKVRKTSVRLRKTSVRVQYTYYQKYPHIIKPLTNTHITKPTHIHTHTRVHTLQNNIKPSYVGRTYKYVHCLFGSLLTTVLFEWEQSSFH